jgi:hypothetical protein
MFNINKTGSTYDADDKNKITKISWKDSHLFFRFGYFRYVKFNAYASVSQYLKMRQKDKQWMKVDMILDWDKNLTALYINETYQITMEFYHG